MGAPPQGAYTLHEARRIAERTLVATGCPTGAADTEHALEVLFRPPLQADVRKARFDDWHDAQPMLVTARDAAGMPLGTEPIPHAAGHGAASAVDPRRPASFRLLVRWSGRSARHAPTRSASADHYRRGRAPIMAAFEIGDTVQITGATMTGNVGTVVSHDDKRDKYLVRVGAVAQDYFAPENLKHFEA